MEIKFNVTGNPVEAEIKRKSLEKLSKLDVDSLKKLADLSENKKALNYLNNPPIAVKLALGLK